MSNRKKSKHKKSVNNFLPLQATAAAAAATPSVDCQEQQSR